LWRGPALALGYGVAQRLLHALKVGDFRADIVELGGGAGRQG
jgi:hypothetical protein